MQKKHILSLLVTTVLISESYASFQSFDADLTSDARGSKRRVVDSNIFEVKKEKLEVPPIPAAAAPITRENTHDDDRTEYEAKSDVTAEHEAYTPQLFDFSTLDKMEKVRLSLLRVNDGTRLITDDQAAQCLNMARGDLQLQSQLRMNATCSLADLHFQHRAFIMSDEGTAGIFRDMLNKSNIFQKGLRPIVISLAKYALAHMRFFNRTAIIKDAQALIYLHETANDPLITPGIKRSATQLYNIMHCENLSSFDTWNAISERLRSAMVGQIFHPKDKDFAAFQLAKSVSDHLTSVMASQCWVQAVRSQHLHQTYKNQAAFELSLMCARNLTQDINVEVAERILLKERDNPSHKNLAQFGLALLCSEKRTKVYKGDLDAAKNLQASITSLSTSDGILGELALVKMRIENRTQIIDDQAAISMLGYMVSRTTDKRVLKKAVELLDKLVSRLP